MHISVIEDAVLLAIKVDGIPGRKRGKHGLFAFTLNIDKAQHRESKQLLADRITLEVKSLWKQNKRLRLPDIQPQIINSILAEIVRKTATK